MDLSIDAGSATPPFEQIRVQVRDAVASGALAAGAKLPTVRLLAEELGLAAGTVARAYRELEADDIIETRGRNGSFVRAQGDPGERAAQQAARAFADTIRRLGVDPATARAYVDAALRS
jgi:DNA-binding transcriptional regulator YhcF (GntR family)